nr:unnamed protein product [Haemonchus contortus]
MEVAFLVGQQFHLGGPIDRGWALDIRYVKWYLFVGRRRGQHHNPLCEAAVDRLQLIASQGTGFICCFTSEVYHIPSVPAIFRCDTYVIVV